MAIYETVFILRQDLTASQVEDSVKAFRDIVEDAKGKILKEESWGLRPLAYKINKNKRGHYTLLEMQAEPAAVTELERRMSINENVLRFITVRLEAQSQGQSAILRDKDRDMRDTREAR